jgi:hypothetical protein
MASAGDGFAVSALTSSGSDSEPAFIDPTNFGQSMPPGRGQHMTLGDLTGSRPPAPPEEQAPQPLQTFTPGSTDVTLRENIIAMFGPTGDNTLSSLTSSADIVARGPAMHATYNQRFGLQHPVIQFKFMNNLSDYLKSKEWG